MRGQPEWIEPVKKELIEQLHGNFEQRAHTADGVEYWHARELQGLLGYSRWENFEQVIGKAVTACETAGYAASDHFREVTKMVDLGSGSSRPVVDLALTRYGCYLIAQNGDPRKQEIAFAQTYFAVQTRRQELIAQRMADIERVQAREKLSDSQRMLSGVMYERNVDQRGFSRIVSKGDAALFGGRSTADMKRALRVPDSRPLADFLPTLTIKAKDFANEVTNAQIKDRDLHGEGDITREHVKNNQDVRKILTDRNIRPEALPSAEDVKKVERRLKAEERVLPKPMPIRAAGKTED